MWLGSDIKLYIAIALMAALLVILAIAVVFCTDNRLAASELGSLIAARLREELLCGEFDPVEYITGSLGGSCFRAILAGNAVIVSRNDQRYGT